MNDLVITLMFFLPTLAFLLIHAHVARSYLVERIPRDHLFIALRLAIPFLLLTIIFQSLGVSTFHGYLLIIALFLCSLGAWTFNILGIAFILFAYIFYQWAFWFPDRGEWFNSAALKNITKDRHRGLIGSTGITITPLKPTGKIRIGEKEYEASCEGAFLPLNEWVTVTGTSSFALIVNAQNKSCEPAG